MVRSVEKWFSFTVIQVMAINRAGYNSSAASPRKYVTKKGLVMKRILTIGFASLIIFNLSFAQKRSTVLGDAITGEVVATDDNTREITIKYEDKGKTETFTGTLVEGYQVKMKDGSSYELKVSDIPSGWRVRIFYKTKEQDTGGKKVKIYRISRVDFLGKDEFSRLRVALNLDQSTPVALSETSALSTTKPLKIYLAIEDERTKDTFVGWVSKWNKEQAGKYGALEIVTSLAEADVSLVILKGAENVLATPFMIGADEKVHNFPPITVFLVSKKNNGLEVLWKQVFLANPESTAKKSRLESEIEKRMKARLKQ